MNKRVQAFLAKMQEKELDGIIINNLKNVYYLTGFWGSNGTVFISRDRQVLVTDSRYIIAAKQETSGFEVVADRDELAVIAGIVKDMCLSRIGFEDEISVSYYHRMQATFEGIDLLPQTQFVEGLRMIRMKRRLQLFARLVLSQTKLSATRLTLLSQERLKLRLPTSLTSACVSWEHLAYLLIRF